MKGHFHMLERQVSAALCDPRNLPTLIFVSEQTRKHMSGLQTVLTSDKHFWLLICLKNLHHILHQSEVLKTKTNCDSLTHVFPCFAPASRHVFDSSFEWLSLDWLSLLRLSRVITFNWFWFYSTQLKMAPYGIAN